MTPSMEVGIEYFYVKLPALFGVLPLSFLITNIMVLLCKRVAFSFNILDYPDGKLKDHAHPTPYLGGVAIFVGMLSLFFLHLCSGVSSSEVAFWFLGIISLFLVGICDDIYILSPFYKFIGQLGACFFFIAAGYYFDQSFFLKAIPYLSHFTKFTSLLGIFLSLWWQLSIINAFNLIDIMDGLATGVAILATGSFLLYGLYSNFIGGLFPFIFLSSFLGALIAFFLHNRPKASIYLGDAGSLLLGGVLGTAPFKLIWAHTSLFKDSFFIPFLVLAIPILEICALIGIRLYKKLPIYYGSPHHFVSYLKIKGWSVQKILFFTALLGFLWSTVAFVAIASKTTSFTLVGLVAFLTLGWIFSIYF